MKKKKTTRKPSWTLEDPIQKQTHITQSVKPYTTKASLMLMMMTTTTNYMHNHTTFCHQHSPWSLSIKLSSWESFYLQLKQELHGWTRTCFSDLRLGLGRRTFSNKWLHHHAKRPVVFGLYYRVSSCNLFPFFQLYPFWSPIPQLMQSFQRQL